MTSIKISQLPAVSELSLDDVLIINDTSQNPVFTAKASVGQVLAFAESTLTFTTADVILVNPQQYRVGAYNPSDVVSIRTSVGTPDGNLPPLPPGGLTTQEDTNIYNVFALAALDESIIDIQNNGAGVIEVTGGFGIKTDPLAGITGSGTVEVDPLQVVTITDEQVISGRKTFTDVATFNEKVYANNGMTVKGDIVDTGNMTVSGNVTAVQYYGDGSQLTGIAVGGTVSSITPGDGLLQGVNTGSNNDTPITSQGTISVNNTVVRTTGDQSLSGVKTFTGQTDLDGGAKIGGDLVPTAAINIGIASSTLFGDGSNITGLPPQGVTSVTPADGLRLGPTTGANNDTPLTSTGSISVDNTVLRDTGVQSIGTASNAGSLVVEGNITSTSGVFQGDGSGLSNISAVAGPFTFHGPVDVVNGTPPDNPQDAQIYFNTVTGVVNSNWPPLVAGTAVGIDQMVVYSGSLGGWVLGSALDRGTFLPIDGGELTGSLIIDQHLTVKELATFEKNVSVQGTVTAVGFNGPLTGNVTGNVTGDVTGDLSGNASTATNATNASKVNLSLGTGTNDFHLAFSSGINGNQALFTDGNLVYNAETNTLGVDNVAADAITADTTITAAGDIETTAGSFIGNLTGNATTATTATNSTNSTNATNADNVKLTLTNTDATFYVPYSDVTGGTGTYDSLGYDTALSYNPANDTLTAGNVVGSTSVVGDTVTGTTSVSGAAGSFTNSVTSKNVTASGVLTAESALITDMATTGDVTLDKATVTNKLDAGSAEITGGADIQGGADIDGGVLFSGGNVEITGQTAEGVAFSFVGDGSGLTNLQVSGASGGTVTSVGAGTGLTVADGDTNPITGIGTLKIDDTVITTDGGQTISGELTVSDLVVTDGDELSDSIVAPGVIRGGYFVGDGSGLSNLPAGTGTVTDIRALQDGGIVTSPATTDGGNAGGITTTGTLSLDSTVVRTTGPQTIEGQKTFTAQGDFQAGLDITGDVGGGSAVYYGDGSNLSGVSQTTGTVESVTAGDGILKGAVSGSSNVDSITTTGTLSVDNTVVRTTGTQSIGGTKTFSAAPTLSAGATVNNDLVFADSEINVGNSKTKYYGDGSNLSGIKAGMFTFKGDTSVLGEAPSAEPGDVFQNTTAGNATVTWTGIHTLPVAVNQLVIYGVGSAGTNEWVRGAIADVGQYLSTANGGTVEGDCIFEGDVQVGGTLTGDLTGNATSATNATNATTAANVTRTVNAGNGMTGGGELTGDITVTALADGNTIGVSAAGLKVNEANITSGGSTKTNVTQTNADGFYYLTAATSTGQQGLVSDTGIYMNPSESAIYADLFEGSGINLTDVVYDTTDQSVSGVKTFTSFPQVPYGENVAPANDTDVASKGYVDDKVIASGSGTVVSVGVITNGGLITSLANNAAISTSGELGVDQSAVVMVDTTQTILGTKTFSVTTNFSQDIDVTGDVTATEYYGDGSNLTGVSNNQGTVTSITAGTGISVGGDDITVSGSIAVDNTVVRTTGDTTLGTASSASNLTVNGNITSVGGVFTGDGSGLFNLPIALGPFNFKGEVDVTDNADLPDPVANGDVYVNTTAGQAGTAFTGISGQTVVVDQIVVYQNTSGTPGWLIGSALDRGQFLPTSGGTVTGNTTFSSNLGVTNNLTVSGNSSVGGTSTFTGLVSSVGGVTITGSGLFTGDLDGDVTATTITSDTITTTGDITCTSPGEFVGTLKGAASSAALADAVVVAQATDDVDYMLTFAQVGDKPVKVNSNLAFNPTDNVLEVQSVISSTQNITTTAAVSAGTLIGNGQSVTQVDALTCKKSVTGNNGLTGGGTLSANQTIGLNAGQGIEVSSEGKTTVKLKASGGLGKDGDGLFVEASDLAPAASISTTPPQNAVAGDLWWDSDDGQLYIYYTDAGNDPGGQGTVSSQWVSATPIASTQAAQISALQAQVNSLLSRVAALES